MLNLLALAYCIRPSPRGGGQLEGQAGFGPPALLLEYLGFRISPRRHRHAGDVSLRDLEYREIRLAMRDYRDGDSGDFRLTRAGKRALLADCHLDLAHGPVSRGYGNYGRGIVSDGTDGDRALCAVP